MKWWRIERRLGYKKSLKYLKVNEDLIRYLTTMITYCIDEKDYIFLGYDEKRNNPWRTDWIWNFELKLENDDIYCGVFNIQNERKKKLKKIENEGIHSK